MRASQIVLGFLVVVAFGRTLLQYRERKIRVTEFVFWSGLWLAALVAIAIPDTTAVIARALGIGRGVDVVIYLSGVLTFYLLFRLYEKIERLEHDITRIVRHIALSERDGP